MERVSLVFGGSILAPPEPQAEFLHSVAQAIRAWSAQRKLFVVVGGGAPARLYIKAARAAGVAEDSLDRIGIQATRLNAQTLACILHRVGVHVNLEVPHTVPDALRLSERYDVVVMGGTEPGHSTDYVAVELAVKGACARFVDATNVDGVYTKDPKKHQDAQLCPQLDFAQLLSIVEERTWTAAGSPGVLDGPATVLLAAHAVPTCVVRGDNLENLGLAVAGKPFRGTRIAGDKVATP